LTGLSAGTEYVFRVTSVNSLIPDVVPVESIALKTTGIPTVPTVPTVPSSPSYG
jgi:hypothetical protein